MNPKNALDKLPFSSINKLNSLVENRRAYTLHDFELNIFETYEASMSVPLEFSELVIINMIQGKKVMHFQDKVSFDYFPGETLLLPEYTKMSIDFPEACMEEPAQCTAITIDAKKVDEVVNYLNEFYPNRETSTHWSFQLDKFHFSNSEELCRLTNRLFQVSLSGDMHKEALADLVLRELLIRIMQLQGLLVLEENTAGNSSVFTHIKQYVRENITEKLSVDKLCKRVGMSKSTLSRAFKTEFGISPIEFVIRERLKYAKKMLQVSKSVKEACFSAGFSDVNYFIRIFKQREGLTPGEYVLKH
ncbi:AraC family transcriptional regulator [Sphingobacterium wenxiniae]|uniref:Helix-turn-helix domain-containing protein n=1 Tax=Sphingobacterium wenxiniae TaxID=683125 RepID=A0A1I6V956_9SPHI|nr:AraC family transcriptional regulator [Sphingobacterium wenxiniae]SFT10293.1 Helix-turn-helix domain-containing protein [Sphingobacterium wenxiniae]